MRKEHLSEFFFQLLSTYPYDGFDILQAESLEPLCHVAFRFNRYECRPWCFYRVTGFFSHPVTVTCRSCGRIGTATRAKNDVPAGDIHGFPIRIDQKPFHFSRNSDHSFNLMSIPDLDMI